MNTDGRYSQPEWFIELPDRLLKWCVQVMDPEHFGLFRNTVDSDLPWEMQTAWHMLLTLDRLGMVDRVPGYSEEACAATVAYMQSLQDPETGVFENPHIDSRHPDRDNEDTFRVYRIHNAGRAAGILRILGGRPQYPVPALPKDERGVDGAFVMKYVRDLPWNNPWAACSHTCRLIVSLFREVEDGNESVIPLLREALEFVIAKQNPKTGLWGKLPETPEFQQISGTLKILPSLISCLGLTPPYMDRIADSCIRLHREGRVYDECTSACIPRNIDEVAGFCLETGDDRADEIRETLADIAAFHYRNWQTPDGGFCDERSGRSRILGACAVEIAGPSDERRGDVGGFNCMVHGTGVVAGALGWDTSMIPSPTAGWRDRVARLRHRVILHDRGRIEIATR